MKIANTIQDSIVDGPGLRFTIFTQGCPHRCPGCHNPETHDFSGGKDVSTDRLIQLIKANPLLDGITFSGGEPFYQAADCAKLAQLAHELNLSIWTYTGYIFETLLEEKDPDKLALLEQTDVLVDGPFLTEQKSLTLLWRGSRNQRIIDVRKSLAAGYPIMWEKSAYIDYKRPD